MDDRDKERIKANTEAVRLIVVGLLTIGGGTIDLVLRDAIGGAEIFFIAWGMLFAAVLATTLYHVIKKIKQQIK